MNLPDPCFIGLDVSKVQGVGLVTDIGGNVCWVFGVCERKKTIEAGAALLGMGKKARPKAAPVVRPAEIVPFDFRLLPEAPERGDESIRFRRLGVWKTHWTRFAENFIGLECYAGLEDYAYGAQTQSYSLGECGGAVRLAFTEFDVPIRLHDPDTVKLWGASHGHATKEMLAEALRVRRPDVAAALKPFAGMETNIVEGLVDAYWLNDMTRTEFLVRTGRLALSSLPEIQLRVFNRTTKAAPVNILGRDWSRA